jgi:hypothetical protein
MVTIDLRKVKDWKRVMKRLIPLVALLSALGFTIIVLLPPPYEIIDYKVVKWMGGGLGAGDVDVYSDVCFRPSTNLKYWTDGMYSFPEIRFPGSGKLNLSTFWWYMNYSEALVNVTWKNMTTGNVTFVVDSTAGRSLLTIGGLTPNSDYDFYRDSVKQSTETTNGTGYLTDLECVLGSSHTFKLETSTGSYDFTPTVNPTNTNIIQFDFEMSSLPKNVTPTNQSGATAIIKIDWDDRANDAELDVNFTTFLPSGSSWEIYADPDGTFDDGDTVTWSADSEGSFKEVISASESDPEYIWLKLYVAAADNPSGTFNVCFGSREEN